ncbi:hypothetical protein [Streptomyces sp. A1136]|uniref:hypothetical protein n=1 Tax=Streptomyces sp. A1136 TaxID=2563102 RepID=UPI001F0D7C30|nr:hypothetical protein [Streptomyces sp. A1136]
MPRRGSWFTHRKSEVNGIPPAFQHLRARAVAADAAARALREDKRLREHVAVYAQVIHELRTELDRRTDNTTQRSPVRSLPTSIT